MTEQPTALRHANKLDAHDFDEPHGAAAELRRLSAVEAQRDALLVSLKEAIDVCGWPNVAFFHKALAAIKAVEEEKT